MLVARCALFVAGVVLPAVHVGVCIDRRARGEPMKHALLYSLSGGTRQFLFQLVAVALWALALGCCLAPAALLPAHISPTVSLVAAIVSLAFFVKGHVIHKHVLAHAHAYRFALLAVISACGLSLAATASALVISLPDPGPPELSAQPMASGAMASDTGPLTTPASAALLRLLRPAWLPEASTPHISSLDMPLHAHTQFLDPAGFLLPPPSVRSDDLAGLLHTGLPAGAAAAAGGGGPDSVERSSATRLAHAVLALACVVAAAASTHGAAGYVLHVAGRRSRSSWHFFQPFKGGAVFIATQILSWTLVATVVLGLVHLCATASSRLHLGHPTIPPWLLAICMNVSPVSLTISVLTFSEAAAGKGRMGTPSPAELAVAAAGRWVRSCAWTALVRAFMLGGLYMGAHAWVVLLLLPTVLLSASVPVLAAQLVLHTLYFYKTLQNRPWHTGCRRWPAFERFCQSHLEATLTWWTGDCRVVKAFEGSLEPERKYIFAYAPHGMMPAGAAVVAHLRSWLRLFPGIRPVVLTASIMHYIPFIRDFGGWAGFRQVSGSSFRAALESEGHVLMCPGGQAELVHASRAWQASGPSIRLCTRHKGFCRVAVEQGASVVPLLCMGEILALRNAVTVTWLQRLTYRWIGFPIPYLLVGHWWTPLPRRLPLLFVVGEPVAPPPCAPDGQVSAAAVDDLHRRYYAAVQALWERAKELHPDYAHHKLQLDSVN